MAISKFSQLETLFRKFGVNQFYVKTLADTQDNEKNQIVLGSSGAKNVLSLFPAKLKYRQPSKSKKKKKSKAGQPIVEMQLNFYWIDKFGYAYHAPHTKIINYFQYPEARLSGFFKNCKYRPNALRRVDQKKFGKRILVIGSNYKTGATYGHVLTEKEDSVVEGFPELPVFTPVPLLRIHTIGTRYGKTPKSMLISELAKICGKWHLGIRLDAAGKIKPFNGKQGGGYTLEALLGVPANANKAPDKHGFELKTFKRSGKISLMTPTADLGEESRLSFRQFIQKYGWKPVRSKSVKRVFNGGPFRFREAKYLKHAHKKLTLNVEGLDINTGKYDPKAGAVYISLKDRQLLLSGWSLDKLLEAWNKKHASACYIEYESRTYNGPLKQYKVEYRFTGNIYIGEGTDIWRYLNGIAAKAVCYDPGHDITKSNKANVRPQWRLHSARKVEQQLPILYEKWELVKLS